uniref:Phosphodiesterase I n=1 Tax=Macrostomum lignano TaxID=282301 RepID=A0A1I8FM63_9PLAT
MWPGLAIDSSGMETCRGGSSNRCWLISCGSATGRRVSGTEFIPGQGANRRAGLRPDAGCPHRRSRIQEAQLPARPKPASETWPRRYVVSAVTESIVLTQATGRIELASGFDANSSCYQKNRIELHSELLALIWLQIWVMIGAARRSAATVDGSDQFRAVSIFFRIAQIRRHSHRPVLPQKPVDSHCPQHRDQPLELRRRTRRRLFLLVAASQPVCKTLDALMAKLLASGGFLDWQLWRSGGDATAAAGGSYIKTGANCCVKEEPVADERHVRRRRCGGRLFPLDARSVNRQKFRRGNSTGACANYCCRSLSATDCGSRLQTAMEARKLENSLSIGCKTSLASSPSKQSSGAANHNAAHPDVASTSTAAPKEAAATLPANGLSDFRGRRIDSTEEATPTDPAVEPNVDLDADDDVSDSAFVEKETDDVTMLVDDDNDVEEDGDDDTPDAVAKRALANRIASRLATKTRLLDLPRVSEFFRVYLADTDAPPMPLNMSTASAFRRLLSSRERLLRQSMDAGDDDDNDVDTSPIVGLEAPDFLSQEELQLESFDDDVGLAKTRTTKLVEHRPASHLTARADRAGAELSQIIRTKRLTAKDLQQFKTECVVGDYRLDSLVNVALGNGGGCGTAAHDDSRISSVDPPWLPRARMPYKAGLLDAACGGLRQNSEPLSKQRQDSSTNRDRLPAIENAVRSRRASLRSQAVR